MDHRADIYALGVVFYQMLTGELPGKTIEPPSKKVQIDVRLDEVVLRALEKKPELRYQQASVLKTQVETILQTEPEGTRNRASESRPRYSRADIVGTVLLFLVLPLPVMTFALGWFWSWLIRDVIVNGYIVMHPQLSRAAAIFMRQQSKVVVVLVTLVTVGILCFFIFRRFRRAMRGPAGGETPAGDTRAQPPKGKVLDIASTPATSSPAHRSASRLKRMGMALAAAVILAVVVRTFLIEPFTIRGGSVEPELPVGSRVLVWKLSRSFAQGDILAYRHGDQVWVGRVATNSVAGVLVNRNGQTNEAVSKNLIIGKVISVYWRASSEQRPEALSFGPVMEQTLIALEETNGGKGLRFETDTLLRLPPSVAGLSPFPRAEWVRDSFTGNLVAEFPGDYWRLILKGMKVALVNAEVWDTWPAATLLHNYQPEPAAAMSCYRFALDNTDPSAANLKVPLTLAFYSDNFAGLLQITGFTEAPRGVKIRYKLAPQQTEIKKPTPAPGIGEPLSFGQVIERVVNLGRAGREQCVIDLDAGLVLTPPASTQGDAAAAAKWMKETGVDAAGQLSRGLNGLVGFEMIAIPLGNSWADLGDSVSACSAIASLANGTPGTPANMSGGEGLPSIYAFQTREGARGILEILGFTENPPGVKIRYKLVQAELSEGRPSTPRGAESAVVPESGKVDSPPQARPKNTIHLTVRSQIGQKPIHEFRIIAGVRPGSVGGSDATINWQPHTLRVGHDGSLDWPLEKAYEEMVLRIEADGWLPATTAWLRKGDGPKDLSLSLAEDPGIKGRVLTPSGKPAGGALLALAMVQRDAVLEDGKLRGFGEPLPEKASDRWRRPVFIQTGADGRFVAPQLKDPSAALLIVHESGVRELSFSEFERAADLKLQEWGRIEGRVLWQDRPGTNEVLSLIIHRDTFGYPGVIAQYQHATSDAEGRFVFTRVLPGQVQISRPLIRDGNELALPGLVTHVGVQAGGSTPVVVGGRGRTVKGRLTGRSSWDGTRLRFAPTAPHIGFPGDDAEWKAYGEFQRSSIGPIFFRDGLKPEPDGSFAFPKVLPGTYQLFVDDDAGQRQSAGAVTVEPEKGDGSAQPLDLGEIALDRHP